MRDPKHFHFHLHKINIFCFSLLIVGEIRCGRHDDPPKEGLAPVGSVVVRVLSIPYLCGYETFKKSCKASEFNPAISWYTPVASPRSAPTASLAPDAFAPLLFPPANAPQTAGAGGVAPSAEPVRLRTASMEAGAASASDPFALSCGEFRRLLLPTGAEACSKGHSLFYGQGLGAPPSALRKVWHLYMFVN